MTRPRILDKAAIAIAGLFLCVPVSFSQRPKVRPLDDPLSSRGQRVFASNCAACHGLDGTGTQRAPNIVSSAQAQKLSAEEIHRIVSDGVAGTGMPAFRSLGEPKIKAVTSYLRTLQGKNEISAPSGNPQNGKAIFFAAGGCSGCHMVAGSGGFIGPDLSTYAQTHSADQIRSAITDPDQRTQQGLVTAIETDGRRWEGIVRNEDNFSLQLQSLDGTFHFFSKADLKAIERTSGSIMPANYGLKLSKTQIDDLISYLWSVRKTAVSPHRSPDEDE
jgi:cytochrome c oxidase cbb3-type subunit III